MAREVAWAESASDDLAEIASYIAKDSEFYAAAVVRELIEAARSLDLFVNAGGSCPSIETLPFGSCWSGTTGWFTRCARLRFTYFASFMEHGLFQRTRAPLGDFAV